MTAVGISIGATHSSVAVFRDGEVTVLRNDRGNKLTPSVVAYTGQTWLCGEDALERLDEKPEYTISGTWLGFWGWLVFALNVS